MTKNEAHVQTLRNFSIPDSQKLDFDTHKILIFGKMIELLQSFYIGLIFGFKLIWLNFGKIDI